MKCYGMVVINKTLKNDLWYLVIYSTENRYEYVVNNEFDYEETKNINY